ncbi:MAG: alkaline phosphatase D family protein [Opitutaceae bacterium]
MNSPVAHRILCRGVFAFLTGWSVLAGQTASPFLGGVWSGNVTPTSASVSVRLNAAGLRVRLAISTNDTLTPAVFSPALTTNANSGNSVTLDIAGLQPNTDYDYGIEVANVMRTEPISRGKFRTFPLGAASFRMAFSSCGDTTDVDQRAFAAILAEQPLLFLHLGDFHYADTNTTVAEDYRRNYDTVLSHPVEGALYRNVALAYMWDDHDFAGNDSNSTAVGTAASRTAYRDTVPHYPINVSGGTIAQAFTVGRVRIIMTDLHSAASPATTAESASKTRLGAAQKAWFKQELLAARDAGFPLILWACTAPWIAPAQVGSDSWGGYATERSELASFFKDNRIMNLVLLSGDMHALAFDDGSNSDYALGGGAPLVVLHAAPLTRPGEPKGGPYSAGPLLGIAQYGLFEVTDTGGPNIQCRYTGKRVGEGAKIVFQFNASTSGIVPTSVAGPGGNDRSFVNISTRARITGPGDVLIVGFVIGGTTVRNVLVRAIGPSLAAFGVSDPLARPALAIFRGSNVIASNDDWNTNDTVRLNSAFDRVGAFRLSATGARDAALLAGLSPGPYTVQVTGATGTAGTVLVEAYEVP